METCILHFRFACFFELTMGCAERDFKIDPIFLDWVHLVPGFYFIMKLPCLVDDGVCDVGFMNLVVWVSCKFSIFQEVFNLVKKVPIVVWGS